MFNRWRPGHWHRREGKRKRRWAVAAKEEGREQKTRAVPTKGRRRRRTSGRCSKRLLRPWPNGGSVAGDALAVWIGCESPANAGRNACWDMKAGQRRPQLAESDER